MTNKTYKQKKVEFNNSRHIKKDEDLALLTKNTVMKVKKNGRTLDKFKTYKKTELSKRIAISKRVKKVGYFHLQSFSKYYNNIIKMSYVTLFRRLYANKDVLNTLIKNKIIEVYYSDIPNNSRTSKMRVKVFRNKRKEFIRFILANFLTDYQK